MVNGTSDDYFHYVRGLVATTMEVGREFQPEGAEALDVMRECVAGAREALQVAAERSTPPGPA